MPVVHVKPLNPGVRPGRPLTQGLGFSTPFPYGRFGDIAGRRAATASTAVTWGLGPLGTAVDFPGSTSTSAESSGAMPGSIFYNQLGSGDLTGFKQFTIAVYCMARTTGAGGFGRVLTSNDTNVSIANSGTSWSFTVAGTSPQAAGAYVAGAWVHLVLAYDGATIFGYVDGVVRITNAKTGGMVLQNFPFVIGNRQAGGRGFDGLIDSVHIWPNTVLTPGQIAALAGDPHMPLRAAQRVPTYAFGPASAPAPSPSRLALLGVG